MGNRFRPLVLCYHAASDDWEHPLALPPDTAARFVRRLLLRRYRPATIDNVVAGSDRAFHVTFDDAFKSVQRVVPLLESLGAHATVFACAGLAGTGAPFPLDDAGDVDEADRLELSTLTWDELRDLSDRGVTIGSHSSSHPHLPMLSDAELACELRESRERIEAELGKPCRYLSYPFGDHDARVRTATRRAGYAAAFALPGRTHPVDAFALPRVGVWRGETPMHVAVKTALLRLPAARWVG